MNHKSHPSSFQPILIITSVSFFTFFQFNIDFYSYIGVAVSLLVLLIICFKLIKNKKFYFQYFSCAIANLAVFLFQKYLEGYWPCFDKQDKIYIGYGAIVVVLFLIVTFKQRKKLEETNEIKNFFSERKYDLKRLYDFINSFSVVGIDSFWGEGKTYLFKLLKQKYSDSFHFISICVMTVQIDTIEKYLITEINDILEQNKIFSSASSKLISLLKNDSFKGVGNLFIKNNSYTRLFKQLCKDIQKLEKPILITFEDIDRINNKELIYKIFALSEHLTSETNYIKILFQYDESKLLETLEEKKIYLEKYIPHTLELTPINFRRCLKVLLQEGNKDKKYTLINIKDFDFLFYGTSLDFYLKQYFDVNKSFSLDIYFSIRKVILFLDEIEEFLLKEKDFKDYKKIVITFVFIKHFEYEDFPDFAADEPYSNTKIFTIRDKKYSIF